MYVDWHVQRTLKRMYGLIEVLCRMTNMKIITLIITCLKLNKGRTCRLDILIEKCIDMGTKTLSTR